MPSRFCRSVDDLEAMGRFLLELAPQLPVRVEWRTKARSLDQNALLWKWSTEISAQLGDMTAQEVHCHNKLHFGVPIRREEDGFREVYDRVIRPLSYEEKLEIMGPPIDFPVTRDMRVKQMTQFLDAVAKHWSERGIILTAPEAA